LSRGIRVTDAGDINPGLSLEDAHRSLAEKIQCIINKGGIPFVVGGGNDQSFANADGLMRAVNSGCVAVACGGAERSSSSSYTGM
jgi:hypothetical protein